MQPGLREAVDWSAPELTPTTANDEINTSLAYGFGFDFCGIEIDRATGQVRIDKYVTAHDCGTIINPGLAEGQIRGSFAAAFGATMLEEFVYADDGSFLSGTFADYLAPTAPEMPELTVLHPVQTPSPYTRLGAKGIAEGNQYSTPVCVANAVADALGITDVEIPLTPSRVYEWIHDAERPPPEGQPAAPPAKGRALEGSGAIEVPAPREDVWRVLMDPASLAAVIPGCDSLEQVGDDAYRAVVDLGVGPVRGRFEAQVRLTDLVAPESGTLSGSMIGPLGSSHGAGHLRLEEIGTGTRVAYDYEIHLAGKVASVGGRMLDGAARVLIGQFFAGLVRQAAGETSDAPDGWWARLRRRVGIAR
jgi:2-furoyl-CoA dehydrogenase large subunit